MTTSMTKKAFSIAMSGRIPDPTTVYLRNKAGFRGTSEVYELVGDPSTLPLDPNADDACGISKDEFIIQCLDGTIDAATGATATLDNGAKCFVQAPVPDVTTAGGAVNVTIPAFTQLIGVDGILENQAGGTFYGIGNNSSDGTGVAWSINGTTLTLNDEVLDTKESGYLVVTYLA